MLRNLVLPGWCWILGTLMIACGGQTPTPTEASEPVKLEGPVLASTWPLASLASAVLGPHQPVRCLVPAGEDPAFWQPSDEDLAAALQAPGVLLNGAQFEPWASTANLPSSRTIRTGRAFRSQWIDETSGATHSHGAQGAHSHKGFDPHYWMDPLLALEQARAIQSAALGLGWIDGGIATTQFAELETRLQELDALWVEIATELGSQTVWANHGTYTYPARRHGLRLAVVDIDPDKSWTQEAEIQWAKLETKPRYFLFEDQPSIALQSTLHRKGLQPIVLRPAEAPIDGYSSALDVWREDLRAFRNLLQSPSND